MSIREPIAPERSRWRPLKSPRRAGARVFIRDLVHPLREAKRVRMTPRSFAEWMIALDRILIGFGHLAPAQVTADAVAEFRRSLGQSRSAATVTKYETPLRELLDLAVRRGVIQTNPYKLLAAAERPKRAVRREPRRWRPAELVAVLEAAKLRDLRPEGRQKYLPLVATLVYLGCRIGEALALRWSDVDLLQRTISIRHTLRRDGTLGEPKTRAGIRDVPIPYGLLRILADAKDERAGDDDWVFAARHGRSPVGYWNAVNRGVKPALHAAGIDDARVHDLRHAAASLLIAQGLTPVEVAGLLGHRDATTTLSVYATWFGDERAIYDKARAAFDVLSTAE